MVGLVVLLSACSFAMRTAPSTWTAAASDPPCSESYVRAGFDASIAATAAAGALLTILGPLHDDGGCGGARDQYTMQRSCGTYGFYIGASTALVALFTTSSVIGVRHANVCARHQDERDQYLASQGIERKQPRYHGNSMTGAGLGALVGAIGLGFFAASFPKPDYVY